MEFRIQNFQSIKDQTFIFESLVSIVGPTDRGKSAIDRALKSLFFNEWEDGFLRRGTKKCILTATFPDTFPIKEIVQEKGKGINSYHLKFNDGRPDKDIPKANKGVPEEIIEIGFSILETERGDKFNLNFTNQYDPLFLVAQSTPLVTSFFNKMFNVTKYEGALRKMTSDYIKLNQAYKANNEKLLTKESELKSLEEEHHNLSETIESLNILLKKYIQLDNDVNIINSNIIYLEEFNRLISYLSVEVSSFEEKSLLINRYFDIFKEVMDLNKNITSLFEINRSIEYNLDKDKRLKSVNLAFNDYFDLFTQFGSLFMKIDEYQGMFSVISEGQKKYNSLFNQYETLEELSSKYQELIKVKNSIYQLNELDLNKYYSKISFLDCCYEGLSRIIEEGRKLQSLTDTIERISKIEKEITETSLYNDNLLGSKDRLLRYEEFFRGVLKVCPTCNTSLL